MARLSRTFLLLSLLASACGGSDAASPPPSPPPSGGSGDTVTGRERFGWTQAGSASDASALQFAVYVDGVRRVLEGATCSTGSGESLECSAPLPSMTAGRHTLELAAFYPSGASIVEGPKSAALQLTIAAVVAGAGSTDSPVSALPPPESGPVGASDGTEMLAEIVGSDLLDPVDVAVDGSGRSFVAERGGGVRIFERDGTGDRRDDLTTARDPDAVILSLALAPDFAESHFVYVLKAVPGPEESQALVVRYRESDGRFGQAAVVATAALASSEPGGVIRFGPDGALYVGLGSRAVDADPRRASRASIDGGRILRLTPDGRTPRDNPRASPVYSSGHRDPSGFVWYGSRRTLWEVESGIEMDEVNAVAAGTDYGWPAVEGRPLTSSAGSPAMLLPAGTVPSGMAAVDDERSPLSSHLIVSSVGLQDLLLIKMIDGQPGSDQPVRLLQGRFGAIGQVTAGPGAALYVVTRNRDTWGAGHDVLLRLRR